MQGSSTISKVLVTILFLATACAGTDEDKRDSEEWRPLFNGKNTKGWRGFRSETMPEGWRVVDGALVRTGPGGDIVTVDEYEDFILSFEWRISPGGNSGVFFRVSEEEDAVWRTGPEYQILDNDEHPDGGDPRSSAGANYALHAPTADFTRPVGEWNHAMLEVRGDLVRHWLNDELVVEYTLGSGEWEAVVAASKFASMPRYGSVPRGHIALQDHGDEVAYRNLRILILD